MSSDDDRTVIVRRTPSSAPKIEEKPVAAKPPKQDVKSPDAKKSSTAKPPEKSKHKAASLPPKPKGPRSNAPVIALAAFAFALIGIGSALTAVYLFSPSENQNEPDQAVAYTDAELNSEIVAVEDAASEAEDEALIRAAIKPKIIDLSGDPVIIRQLSTAPRQLVKLEGAPQKKAAAGLGIKGEVYRMRDALDHPDANLRNGILGGQEEIATSQQAPVTAVATTDAAADDGSSVALAGVTTNPRIAEFAEQVTEKTTLAAALQKLGATEAPAKAVEAVFRDTYQTITLQKDDRIAVRMISEEASINATLPVQVSLYRSNDLVGSLALNDIEKYAPSADPWLGRDIFEAPLLPTVVNPEDQPRLLDAIYATALRNRLPSPVIGETIMMLSRTFDLEQKLQPGDNITLIYSPNARDTKTGLGRIVYASIDRASESMECFVVASGSGEFACANLDGAGGASEPGIIKPVNGVVVAKFGPQGDSGSPDEAMNFGTEWTAPKGTPVVAAFAGAVSALGRETGYGTVVRLTHADGSTTMYAYLERAQTGLSVGAQVKAGQVIGYVGTPPTSREPRLYFELRRGGVPVDPEGEMQASVGSGSAVDQFVNRIIYIESGNNCRAKNPLSTATGLGQFIDSTWMTTIRLHRPDLLKGRSRREVLDLRFNCDLSKAMTTAFTRDNAAVIRRAGKSVTPGNLYLAHFLGVGGAVKALSGNPNAQIAAVFGEHHVRANPFERGKSIGWLVSWAAKKMGGKTPKAKTSPSSPIPPADAVAANKKDGKPAQKATTEAAAEPAESAGVTSSEPMVRSEADPQLAQLKAAIATLIE